MKKIIFSLIAILTTVCAMAQGPQRQQLRGFSPEQMAERTAKMMKEACQLTDEQYQKVYDYTLAQSKKQQAERDSVMKLGQDEQRAYFRQSMTKRMEEQKAAMKSILTEEQYAKYEKYLAESRQRMGNRNGNRNGGQRPRGPQQ